MLDAAGGAVMPGLVDGMSSDARRMDAGAGRDRLDRQLSARRDDQHDLGRELHVSGIDYDNLRELVTSLAVVTAATTGRVRWSGVKACARTACWSPG